MRKDETRWHSTLIADVKRQIRDEVATAGDHWAQLALVHQQIEQYAADDTPLGQLRRFVYIMNALIIGQRHHGLKPTQVRQLATLGRAILTAQGVRPRISRISFLHAELHTVLSQIHRQSGQQWAAAWEQSYAVYAGLGRTSAEKGLDQLTVANRALRLGHVRMAIASFQRAEELGLGEANFARARLGRIKALRLGGDPESAAAAVHLAREEGKLTGPAALELEWEGLCLTAQGDGDFGRLRSAVGRGGAHRQATYMVEASLWLASTSDTAQRQRLPKLRYLSRLPEHRPQRLGLFFKIALQIERCYDFDSPLAVRLNQLGTVLPATSRLVSIDKELLVWAASARWLARSKSHTLASLALNEYEALSLRLTRGARADTLGLVGDLLAKDWYTGLGEAATTADPDGAPGIDGGADMDDGTDAA